MKDLKRLVVHATGQQSNKQWMQHRSNKATDKGLKSSVRVLRALGSSKNEHRRFEKRSKGKVLDEQRKCKRLSDRFLRA